MNLLRNLYLSLFGGRKDKRSFSYHRDFRYMPGKQIQQFTNKTSRPLDVHVEMYSDLYVLHPEDEMTIIYDQDLKFPGLGLSTIVTDNGLIVYLQEFETAVVLINGRRVEPWSDKANTTVITL